MVKRDKRLPLRLIYNPGAGNPADTKDKLGQATALLEDEGFRVDVIKARPKGKATDQARKAVKDGYKTVVAMGGDGMVEAVMRGMAGTKARLGIIPTGIENNIARSLGIPPDLEQACRLVATDNTRKMDVREVKTQGGKWFPFFEVVGMGYYVPLIPDGTATAGEELSNPPMAADMPRQPKEPPCVVVSLDGGREMELNTPLVMVSNSCVFGEKYKVIDPQNASEDNLDISIFDGYSRDDVRRYYAGMKDVAYPFNGTVQRYQSCDMKITSTPKMKVMADGVDLGKGDVSIKVKAGALRIIASEETPENTTKNPASYGSQVASADPDLEGPFDFGG